MHIVFFYDCFVQLTTKYNFCFRTVKDILLFILYLQILIIFLQNNIILLNVFISNYIFTVASY